MKVRAFVLPAAFVIALALSACGNSSKNTTSATSATGATTTNSTTSTSGTTTQPAVPAKGSLPHLDEEFIAEVDAVCARANAQIKAQHGEFPYKSFDPLHPDTKLLPKVGEYFAATQGITDRVPHELGELEVPAKGSILWHTLLEYAARERAIADRQISAAKAADAAAFVTTVKEIQKTNATVQKLALAGGFKATSPCTQLF